MRVVAWALAAVVIGGPAAAELKEYKYDDEGFSILFPAEPQVEEMAMYAIVPGRTVPARVYSVRHENSALKVTVAQVRNAGLAEEPIVQHAIAQLTMGGTVTTNVPNVIYQIYGRQLAIDRPAAGTYTRASVYFANDRLYVIEGTRFAGAEDIDMLQFQQSLDFPRDVRNRTEAQLASYRAACTAPAEGRDEIPDNPAGLDDPRCAR